MGWASSVGFLASVGFLVELAIYELGGGGYPKPHPQYAIDFIARSWYVTSGVCGIRPFSRLLALLAL